jgi:hypothetical protein
MRVDCKCAHHVRPPLRQGKDRTSGGRQQLTAPGGSLDGVFMNTFALLDTDRNRLAIRDDFRDRLIHAP